MIEIKNFTFTYRESTEPVVKDINLSIPAGAFVGITARTAIQATSTARLR